MYLSSIKLWNFRKYGAKGTDGKDPGLIVEFKPGLNVLIGENDSGKTAIIDAIRYILNTRSYEQVRIDEKDFNTPKDKDRSNTLEIECIFSGIRVEEAANFLEWAYFNSANEYELRVHLKAVNKNNRITVDIKAGPENADTQMDGNARELLKVTYLKPLRDAENELTPGYRSRLAQILLGHEDFQKEKDGQGKLKSHIFEDIIKEANSKIEKELGGEGKSTILKSINEKLKNFLHRTEELKATISVAPPELQRILRSLSLKVEENTSGLGTLNKLFMAAELLHIEKDGFNGLKLCLIEELEAHLHPQAQLRVIKALKDIESTQIILTTHSTTLGASIDLKHLILCHGNGVYPMWEGKTELQKTSYKYLERFLDVTKANLFFARGVILVEGDTENIVVPAVAEKIGKPLAEFGVSVVNVGNTRFLHYANIFKRKDGESLNIPVAIITDLDVRALEYYQDRDSEKKVHTFPNTLTIENKDISELHGKIFQSHDEIKEAVRNRIGVSRLPNGAGSKIDAIEPELLDSTKLNALRENRKVRIEKKYNGQNVKAFTSKEWTFEYDIARSQNLRKSMDIAIQKAVLIKKGESYEECEGVVSSIDAAQTSEAIAYSIFKPFLENNKPSKAVTAQFFAEQLSGLTTDIIKADEYMKYMVDAIEYACGNQGGNQ